MKKNKSWAYLLASVILALCGSVFVFGQAETGQITGTVTDPSGAVVSKADVTVQNTGTGQARTVQTNNNGSYTVTNLEPGTYEVTVAGGGFSPFKRNIDVTVGGRATVDAQLTVSGGAGTTVEVIGEGGAQVNTQDQQISQVVNQAQIQELPTLNRDPYSLVQIAGNVTSDPNGSTVRGVGVAINGQRAASTDILLDGGENVDLFGAGLGQTVPLDSVQEFRVVTGDFTAEYGRASGGVVNVVTRSGTNNFHGTAYEFNRPSVLASRTFQESAQNLFNKQTGAAAVPQDHFVRNQFGYSLGGPVIRDKIFFFSSTEWTRVRSSGQETAYVLDPAFLATTASNTQAFFQKYGAKLAPGATRTGQTVMEPGYTVPVFDLVNYTVPANAGAGDPQNTYSTVNRIDLNPTNNTSIYGRYALFSQNAFPGTNAISPYAGYDTGYTNYDQNAMFNLTHTFSPTVLNQFKAVYNRLTNQQPLGTAPVGPTLYLQRGNTATVVGGKLVALPGYLPFSPGNAIPFGGPQNLYQFFDDFSVTRGTHQLRFGGSYIHIRDNRVFGAYETSVEQLGNNSLSQGLSNLVSGNLYSFQGAADPKGAFPCPTSITTGATISSPGCQITLPVTPPDFERNNRYNDGAAYAQDTWKTTSKLTLDLGLRWEYYGPQHSANPNIESNFYFGTGNTLFDRIRGGYVATTPNSPTGGLWKSDYKDFAPRIGFAYDPFGTGKWSIRGGYGISYERNFGNVTYNVIQNPPHYAVVSLIAGTDVPTIPITTDNAGPLAGSGVTKNLPKVSLRAVDPHIKSAYAEQYSFAVEHEVVPNTLLSVNYSGSRGVHLYGIANINRAFFGQVYEGDTRGCTGSGATATCSPKQSNRLNQQYTNINFRSSDADSYYNSLNVRLQSSNFRNYGIQLTANYTYAHSIDDLSSTFSESGNNFNLGFLDPFNPGADRGNSDFDVRHRLIVAAIWQPTFLAFKNSGLLTRSILGGWEITPIFSVRTGTPFTVYDCTNGFTACPRIIDVAGMKKSGGTNVVTDPTANGVNVYNYLPIPANSANPYMNPVIGASDLPICATPGAGGGSCTLTSSQVGMGRNAFYGPGFWNLDLGVNKTFQVTERVGIQLRGEFFNVLNHHNFYVIAGNTDFASAVPIQTAKGAIGGTPGPGDERRNVQLGAKIIF